MVLFRGDIKCKSLQRRTSISVILPADNIHFLDDRPPNLFLIAFEIGFYAYFFQIQR